MTSSNGAPAPSSRERILAQIRAEAEQLLARREDLAAELAALDADLRAYQKAARDLGAEESLMPHPHGGRAPKAVKTRAASIGDERYAQVKQVALELLAERGEIRAADVGHATGLSSASLTAAFKRLRDERVIRLARVERSNPRKGKGGKFYKPWQPQAGSERTAR